MTEWENIQPVEVLSLRCKTHTALILMAPVPEGWTFSVDCSRLTGDVSGWAEPLGRRGGAIRPDRLAPSQEAALEAARAVILSRTPDRPLIEWLDSLKPAQPDLFSAPPAQEAA